MQFIKNKKQMKNWKDIKSVEDFHEIVEKSKNRTQIIFKDSTTCGISAYAKERLDLGTAKLEEKADFNYLDLLAYRSISNLIAEELDIRHQSPQILVLRDGKLVHSVTHHSIEPDKIVPYL